MQPQFKPRIIPNTQVEAYEIRSIDRKVYNTIRSFVTSSTHPGYIWNIGEQLGDKIMWRKPGKWKLVCYPYGPEEVVCDLYNRDFKTVDAKFAITPTRTLIHVGGSVYERDSKVAFTADVPNAVPIPVVMLWYRLAHFVRCVEFEKMKTCFVPSKLWDADYQ